MHPIYANVLQPLIDVFEAVLTFFHDSVGFSWGLSIIALTVCVRILMLPLAVKQFRSMQALQRIAPQLKQLQEKYKGDKQRLQQETMKFYSEHKVNPFASCLPLVAQLPVFLSLFYMLRHDLRYDICGQTAQACGESPESKFFFIPDITDKASGIVLVVLVVLYVGSQLLSSLLMMTATTDKNQKMIMLVLPFAFVPFIWSFPAGLLLYWITTNIWTILQQQFLRRVIGRNMQPATTLAGAANVPAAGGALSTVPTGRNGSKAREKPAQAEKGEKPADDVVAKDRQTVPPRPEKAPPPPPRRNKRKRSGRRR